MKTFFKLLLAIIISIGLYDFWHKKFNYNFGVVTENKVYKSGRIEPSEIKNYIQKHNIKTVIDLRDTVKHQYMLDEEKAALDKIANVKYINIRSGQIPNKQNLIDYYNVLDNKDNYPVLVHCYHGLGRTMLYVALYRIEYENMSNEDARHLSRPYPVETFLHHSQFASTKSKGKFLINYIPRNMGNEATIHTIK
jgi:protein tyrosine/serine phosphatase